MLKGLGTPLRMVQTHWWDAGESCAGPLPRILTWWYRWLVRWVLLLCVPKHAERPHITLKPILQTLTTRVWMVSKYHRMGLIVPILFTKSHQTWARWFFQIFEATVFSQHKWEGLLTSSSLLILGPFFQESPHPQALSDGWTLSRAMKDSKKFPSLFVWRERYVIQYSNTGAWKEEGSYAYYLGVGGKSHLWSYAS